MTRIIGGVLGSLRLKGPAKATRPTSDRVKESIFSILDSRGAIKGARVLDLFAGTGALGLEAVSRGANTVTLVEKDHFALKVCEENLRLVMAGMSKVGAPCNVKLVRSDAKTYLKKNELIDLVFVDPPYEVEDKEVVATLDSLRLSRNGVVVLERSAKAQLPNPKELFIAQEKNYGDSKIFLLVRGGAP